MTPVFVMTLSDIIGLSLFAIFTVGAVAYGIFYLLRQRFCSHDWREDNRAPRGMYCSGPIFLHWDCRKCGKTVHEKPLSESKDGAGA